MGKKLPVASHLSKMEYHVLLQVYADHNSSMGLSQRKYYTLSNIIKVENNYKENCLNVYYDNDEWFKYYLDGTWG